MKYKYGANPRAQMLKYHIQTSGRSLHAQEIDFNDIEQPYRPYMLLMTTVILYIPMLMMRPLQPQQKNL